MLEQRHPGYEFRRSQLEMAQIVDDAFQKHQQVVIEAGTGTGKTLAYLIPAIRAGRKVVISTATKSLQEQLFQKDVPFLQKNFAPNLKVALMKGRANFLCRAKVHQMVGPAGAERDRRDRLVRADSRLGKTDGNGRPKRADVSAGRLRAVEPDRRAQRSVHGAKVRGVSDVLHHGDAPARARSGFDHREPSSFLRRPGDTTGRFRLDPAGVFRGGVRRSA